MDNKLTPEESQAIYGNSLLLAFEGFIKYIEGLNKGLQSASTINAKMATDCIGEILEYLAKLRVDVHNLFKQCELGLADNEKLIEENKKLKKKLEDNDKELSKLEVKIAKMEADRKGKK